MQVKKLILSTIALLVFLPSMAFAQAQYVEAERARVHSTTKELDILADGAKQISILNNVGTSATGFYLDATTGALTSVGGATISAPIVLGSPSDFGTLLGLDTQSLIGIATSDAADSKSLYLESGNAASIDGSRGAAIVLDGNEVATTGGTARILAGNLATGNVDLDVEHASGAIRFRDLTTGTLWSITDAGVLIQDATNGGNLQFNKTASNITIGTTDAADNKTLAVAAGSAILSDGTRGATEFFDGNEVATTGGTWRVLAGNVSTANVDLDVENASSAIRFRDTTTGTLWSITDAGVLTQDGTNGGAIQFNQTASNILIGTTDGTDNKTLGITPGSALTATGSRGGTFILDGNEVASTGGSIQALAGNVSTANLDLDIEHASSSIRFKDLTTGTLWSITDAGVLTQDATNGGSLIMSKEDTGVLYGTTALDADVLAVSGSTPHFGLVENSGNQDQFAIIQDGGNANGVQMRFYKTRATAPSSDANTIVQASDTLGTIGMFGADGVDYKQATAIRSIVDGAPSAGVMPGALIFSTKATSSTLDRLKIDSAGAIIVDATNGSDIIMAKASTGLVTGEAARQATVVTAGGTSPIYTGVTANTTHVAEFVGFGAVANGPTMDFFKTRAVTGAPTTIVTSGDVLGRIQAFGANGSGYDPAAQIIFTSDTTPGASTDMPGAIDFLVSPDGSITPASALKLNNAKLATFGGAIAISNDYVNSTAAKGIVLGESARAANVTTATTLAVPIYSAATASGTDLAAFVGFGASTSGATVDFFKTRAVSGQASTIVASGDTIGQIKFFGANGSTYDPAASIVAKSGGTPGASTDMPGSLSFFTTPDGSVTLTQALILAADQSATFAGTVTSSRTTDLGWSFVDQTDNQACNTGCTSACAFGIANATGSAVTSLVSCSDTTADSCICAGAS